MYEYIAKCIRVIDGDTLELDVDLGFGIHKKDSFRLAGINTPETYGVKKESAEYQAGMKAKERVRELIENKVLLIKTEKDKQEKYGRYIASVTILETGVILEQILVQEGLAEIRVYE